MPGLAQTTLDTPLTRGLQAIIAGKTRFGIRQDNKALARISYGF